MAVQPRHLTGVDRCHRPLQPELRRRLVFCPLDVIGIGHPFTRRAVLQCYIFHMRYQWFSPVQPTKPACQSPPIPKRGEPKRSGNTSRKIVAGHMHGQDFNVNMHPRMRAVGPIVPPAQGPPIAALDSTESNCNTRASPPTAILHLTHGRARVTCVRPKVHGILGRILFPFFHVRRSYSPSAAPRCSASSISASQCARRSRTALGEPRAAICSASPARARRRRGSGPGP